MDDQMERKEELKFGAVALPADLSLLQGGGGAAEGEAALALLEKQLICPICLELFNKPVVILPCQHNLCRKCANELYQARTTMLVNSGRFRCPSCRQEVVLDRHGVYGLQRNLLVENIIDAYKQELSSATSLPPPPPAAAQCSDHQGEKVNIFCLTCQVPTCSLCKVFGAHQACEVAPLTDVVQQQKDELSGEIRSLVAFSKETQALVDGLEETCRLIEENGQTQKQSVCDTFQRVFSILEERQKAMTKQISAEQDEKTGHAQALLRCYGDSVEANNKLMEAAKSSMEEPDEGDFVQNSRELITKVITATASCPTETLKPGFENMRRYRYDFSHQERALRSLDFLKGVEADPEEPEVVQDLGDPEEPGDIEDRDPEESEEPGELEEPGDPGELEEPGDPGELEEPGDPGELEEPGDPGELEEPGDPGELEEPGEPEEPPVQNVEPKHLQETSSKDLEPGVEPVREPVPAVTAPPEEPVQTAAPTPTPVPPAPAVVGGPVEAAGAVLLAEEDGEPVQKNMEEEEEEEEEEGCAAPGPVKEEDFCEHEEGMSTQQVVTLLFYLLAFLVLLQRFWVYIGCFICT